MAVARERPFVAQEPKLEPGLGRGAGDPEIARPAVRIGDRRERTPDDRRQTVHALPEGTVEPLVVERLRQVVPPGVKADVEALPD